MNIYENKTQESYIGTILQCFDLFAQPDYDNM